jgi:hypothetical protein
VIEAAIAVNWLRVQMAAPRDREARVAFMEFFMEFFRMDFDG